MCATGTLSPVEWVPLPPMARRSMSQNVPECPVFSGDMGHPRPLRACYALFHAPRRHGIGPGARSSRENWVRRQPFERLRQRGWADSVPPSVGRKRPVCVVTAPQRFFSLNRFVAVPSIRAFCGPSRSMQKCMTRSRHFPIFPRFPTRLGKLGSETP